MISHVLEYIPFTPHRDAAKSTQTKYKIKKKIKKEKSKCDRSHKK